MINKELMKNNFSKNANHYDKYAIVQKKMAKIILDLISKKCYNSVLEIGSGTGCLTKLINKDLSFENYTTVDISDEMMKVLKKEFSFDKRFNFIINDIENLKLEEKFDLIVSNATFQWIEDLKKLFLEMEKCLEKEGEFIFSTFGDGTLREMTNCINELELNKSSFSQNFITEKEISELLLHVFKKYSIIVKKERIYFESFKELLYSINKIGAGSSMYGKPLFTKSLYKSMNNFFNKNYVEYGKLYVTYEIFYVSCRI